MGTFCIMRLLLTQEKKDFYNYILNVIASFQATEVNFSPMSPKLVEKQGITVRPLFWDWYDEKVLPTQFKIHIFCHCQNQSNTFLQCRLLYAQQKTAVTITNKTSKISVKKSSLTKILNDINLKKIGVIVIPLFSTTCS